MTNDISLPSGGQTTRIVALVAAVILGLLATRSALGFALMKTDPALAWRIDGGNAEAGAALSDRLAVESRGPEDALRVRAVAADALLESPFAPQALRNIGFVDARLRSERAALPLLEAAGRASQRDWLAHLWLFDWHYRQGDVRRAIREGAIVMDQQSDRWPSMMPLLIETMDDRAVVAPLADALVRRPDWRGRFLEAMGQDPANLDVKQALLVELKRRGSQPGPVEVATYFRTAYGALPPQVTRARWQAIFGDVPGVSPTLNDGGFEGAAVAPPYVWTLYSDSDLYAERQQRDDGQGRALYVSFERRELAVFAMQALALTPGRYRLSGQALALDATKPGQFSWRITCGQDGARTIGNLPIRANGEQWSTQAGMFEVPADCPSQQIDLRATGDARQREPSTLWVDSVAIAPLGR